MNRSTSFKNFGAGLGLRPCHYQEILQARHPSIGWLEVITENFMNVGGKPRHNLSLARELYPMALHGVGLSIGSDHEISSTYLNELKRLTDWLDPILISDHLCFTSHGRHNSHDLLPIPFTKRLLDRISRRLDQIQNHLGRRFMLENPSAYVAYADGDMTEVEFFKELVSRTGCGILLDLNNLYVNQMNLAENPLTYLDTLPEGAVGQIHLAGHSTEETESGTVRIDTHDHAVREEVWELYQIAKGKWPEASTMIEWDDHIPPLADLLPLLDRIQQAPVKKFPDHVSQLATIFSADGATDECQATLFAMAVDCDGIEQTDARLAILNDHAPVPRILGMQVYNNAYFSRLRDVLRDEFSTLAAVTTEEGFSAIAADYLQTQLPSENSVNRLGRGLASHLKNTSIDHFDFGVPLTALADIAALDDMRSAAFMHAADHHAIAVSALAEISPEAWETVRFDWNATLGILHTDFDVAPLWATVNGDEGSDLCPPQPRKTAIRVWRDGHIVHHQVMDEQELSLLTMLQKKTPFGEAAALLATSTGRAFDEITTFAITMLATWTQQGLIAGIALS